MIVGEDVRNKAREESMHANPAQRWLPRLVLQGFNNHTKDGLWI